MPEVAQGEGGYVVSIGAARTKAGLAVLGEKATRWGKTVGVISPSLDK